MFSRRILTLSIIILLFACAGDAQQKPRLTAERILDQYERATKTQSAEQFKTFHYLIEIWGTVGQQFLGNIEGWYNADGRFLESFTARSHGYYQRGFDGKKNWYAALPLVSDKGVDLPDQFRKTSQVDQIDSAFYGVQLVPFADNWRQHFSEFTILGQGVVEGRKAIVVRGKIEGGDSINFYFDQESMLLLRADFPLRFRNVNGDLRVTQSTRYFKDYAEFSGWKLPRSIRFGDPNSFVDYVVRKVDFNQPVDGAMYLQPK